LAPRGRHNVHAPNESLVSLLQAGLSPEPDGPDKQRTTVGTKEGSFAGVPDQRCELNQRAFTLFLVARSEEAGLSRSAARRLPIPGASFDTRRRTVWVTDLSS
jgi:hypothetical protein